MNWWEELAINIFAAVIHGALSNPHKLAGIVKLLVRIYEDLGQVLKLLGAQPQQQ